MRLLHQLLPGDRNCSAELHFQIHDGDEISATVQILAEKADWMAYHCHEEDTNVINNGGRFVSYRGNTYYWRFAPGSVEETGVLGSFNQVMTVKNDLICRTSDGEETVILQDTGSGPLFICENVFSMKRATPPGASAGWTERRLLLMTRRRL